MFCRLFSWFTDLVCSVFESGMSSALFLYPCPRWIVLRSEQIQGQERISELWYSGMQFRLPLHIPSFPLWYENWDKSLEFFDLETRSCCDTRELQALSDASVLVPSEVGIEARCCAGFGSYHGHCTPRNHAVDKILTLRFAVQSTVLITPRLWVRSL